MSRQLSGFDKFRFVCCVFGLPVTVVAVILNAMESRWAMAALQTFLVFCFVYYLYRFTGSAAAQENHNLAQSTQEPLSRQQPLGIPSPPIGFSARRCRRGCVPQPCAQER